MRWKDVVRKYVEALGWTIQTLDRVNWRPDVQQNDPSGYLSEKKNPRLYIYILCVGVGVFII